MKKLLMAMLTLIILAYGAYNLFFIYQDYHLANSREQKVLIAYNKTYLKSSGFILEAYKSVLTEEGVPWETVEIASLNATAAKKLAQTKPVIIFPDGLLQSMPEESQNWIKEYLDNSGSIAVIYDAGIKAPKGYFLKQALLADIVGVNYITYSTHKEKTYSTGYIKFKSKEAGDFFQIPPGKLDKDLLLSGYIYGELQYPFARNELLEAIPEKNIFASVVGADGRHYPAMVSKKYGKGNVLYINMPLGYLKAYSDDLPLRAVLRTFLFQIVKIPHLINTDTGKGGLVINWHIDSNIEWPLIPAAIKNKVLDKNLRYSIHITAGDFRDQTGDAVGFDACGKGRTPAQLLLPYGKIGSHGGWAHNWFADNLENNKFSDDEIRLYITKNKTCLESITNYPLLEYSAPVGVHPQPVTTTILEKLGFTSYYYTGDSGSAPNRTFHNGKMVSSQVIAFPVLAYDKSASFYEMKESDIAEKDVQKWLINSVDYVIQNRTTRLFYSHLHDVSNYPKAIHNFLQYAKLKQTEGKLQIEPMSDMASFFQKFIKTELTFHQEKNDLSIVLKNKAGLKGITVAVPRARYSIRAQTNISLTEDENYYYLTVNEDVKEKNIIVSGI